LSLYCRLGSLTEKAEIVPFAAELIDRFDPRPKGAVFGFRNNRFGNPEGLVRFIAQQAGLVKLRPDHKLVYMRIWDTPKERLRGVHHLAETLAKVAA
jgi:transcription-repair coupling factor (superfamily II helicase)